MPAQHALYRLFCMTLMAFGVSGCATISLPALESAATAAAEEEALPPIEAPDGFLVEGVTPAVWHALQPTDREQWLDTSVKQAHAMIARSSCGDLWRAQQGCSEDVSGTYHLMDPNAFRVVLECPQTRSADVYWFVAGPEMQGPDVSNARPVCSDGALSVYYGHVSTVVQNAYR